MPSSAAGTCRARGAGRRMKVDRIVLREAMKVLSANGLVGSRQKVGTRASHPRHRNLLDADVLTWRCAAMATDDFGH